MNEGNNNESLDPRMNSAQGARRLVPDAPVKAGIIEQLKLQQRVLREQLRRADAALDAFENAPLVAQAFDELSAPVK